MTSHSVGGIRGTRLGSDTVSHTFPMSFADASAVAKKLCTIDGSVQEPIAFRIDAAVIMTQFNGTVSAVLSAGIVGATYVDMINAQDVRAAAVGTNLTLAANGVKIVTAPTDIYALVTQGGTLATAGLVYITVEIWSVNTTEPTNQGA